MRIINEKENKGLTLVEIIVSMLVLSITIVSVLSAFTVSAKSNKLTRKLQSAEALMEDLSEYVEAGGERIGDENSRNYEVFGDVTVPGGEVDATEPNKKSFTIENVSKGFNTYTVKVTENSAPEKYSADNINDYEVFAFGGSGSNAIFIDASANVMQEMENEMLNNFKMLHENAVQEYNDELLAGVEEGDPQPEEEDCVSEDTLKQRITREIQVRLEMAGANQVVVKAVAVYKFEPVAGFSEEIRFPSDEESKIYERQIYQSAKYNLPSESTGALNQIYLLHSQFGDSVASKCEIRILNFVANNKCDIYLIRQNGDVQGEHATPINSANLYNDLNSYAGSSATTIVSFITTNASEPVVMADKIDLYCSELIQPDPSGTKPGWVSEHQNTLIASQEKVRAVEITVDIIDPETGSVLLTNTGVYLQ